MPPVPASRPPGRVLLRIAGVLTQLLCAGCLLLGTIAFVLVQQNRMGGAGLVILWAVTALIGLVFGGLMGRGGLISLVVCAVIDATFGIVLLAIEYDTLRAILKVLPESDVATIADIVSAVGACLLIAFGMCLIAIPQALRYTRWMHAETEPRLASSTARGFPPPPIAAAHGSVWQLPIVAPEESRSRRRMYFALAGFAIGFGAGIGVLVSSSPSQRQPGTGTGSGTGTGTGSGSGSGAITAPSSPGPGAPSSVTPPDPSAPGADGAKPAIDAQHGGGSAGPQSSQASVSALIQTQRAAIARGDLAALSRTLAPGAFGFGVDADEVAEGRDAVELLLRKDLGELVRDGASVDLRFSTSGEQRDHAWIALELEVSAANQPSRRFAVTELAARVGGAWTVVAWHWATPVLDKTAERMVALGTKPTPKPIASVLTGPKALEDAVHTAFGSRRAFAAARSENEHAFNFGSGPSERVLGGGRQARVQEPEGGDPAPRRRPHRRLQRLGPVPEGRAGGRVRRGERGLQDEDARGHRSDAHVPRARDPAPRGRRLEDRPDAMVARRTDPLISLRAGAGCAGPAQRASAASSAVEKKNAISSRAVSGPSDPWTAFRSMFVANSLRIVPAAAFSGFVAPMTSRFFAIASSPSRTCTTTGPSVMNFTRSA
jgi:hypothetical protein